VVSHVGTLGIYVGCVCVYTICIGNNTGFTFPEMKPEELHRASKVGLLKVEQKERNVVLAHTVFSFFLSLIFLFNLILFFIYFPLETDEKGPMSLHLPL